MPIGSWLLEKLVQVWGKVVAYLVGAGALGLLGIFGIPPALTTWVNNQSITYEVKKIVYSTFIDTPMTAGTYNILIADLANDLEANQTRHVQHSLEEQFDASTQSSSVRIQRLNRRLEGRKAADTATELRNASQAGRELLSALNADLLVWGEVARSTTDKVILRLRFLPRAGEAPKGAKSYALNEYYELAPDFGNDLGAMLAAIVASSITPAIDDANARGRYMADVLKPLVDKLGPLVERPPAAFTPDQVADLRLTYLTGSFALGRQRGDPQQLRNAVDTAQRILQYWTRDKAPEKWAKTQNLLGAALTRLGHRDHGTQLLNEAAQAYREALTEWTRDRHPVEWSNAQNNLGNALWALGYRDTTGTKHVEQAVAAYRASLEEVDRSKRPIEWALRHHNVGNALVTLGERTRAAAPLREAVQAFETALLERVRDKVPLDWSASKNGLAEAFMFRGIVEGRMQDLEQALAEFSAALEERPRPQLPLAWGVTRRGMARTLAKLSELKADRSLLLEAQQAARESVDALATDPGTRIEAEARQTLAEINAALEATASRQ